MIGVTVVIPHWDLQRVLWLGPEDSKFLSSLFYSLMGDVAKPIDYYVLVGLVNQVPERKDTFYQVQHGDIINIIPTGSLCQLKESDLLSPNLQNAFAS